jgi:CheY-like chemotaxis protein
MIATVDKILVVHADLAVCRLVRESLETFCECQVETTSVALGAFERVLQKDFKLVLFDLHLETLPGPLLHDLICRALKVCASTRPLPAVMFFCEASEVARRDDLLRDARVKGLLTLPLNIERLLEKVRGILPLKRSPFE